MKNYIPFWIVSVAALWAYQILATPLPFSFPISH
jgi:hypothetical protein